MKPKLNDVAREAGVSPTTVSRVINNHGYLSEETKNKVFQAMKRLNYQPNSIARSLHGKQTNLIGVLFSSVSNPFFGELVEKIENKLFKSGYKTILCNSADNKEKERVYLNMLIANQVDGIIAGAHNLGIKEYEKVGLPIISFDRFLSSTIPIVSSDNYQGGVLATQELYQSGARKIYLFASSHTPNSPTDKRRTGYLQTMEKLQLEAHEKVIASAMASNVKALMIKQILSTEQMDSIFCTDDLTALIVLRQAKELGIHVPQDLKVIGYDGTQFIQNYHPELTTIAQPINDMAELLVELLLKRVTNEQSELKEHYVLPIKLIRNQSSSQFI
ncbi:LacI family DNA-binding transcriptional regulator [Sporolactobacillus pectinivorans]|uniref:LacI family DNA-binding transcriptional regulator n=1 Tax=Sporolactobacillus pectinivorans TaxID=1591408 RepID=UPI000C266477|nr:LacI family DNA-binding transcriptional regulator [Sporolactobacillus pectinivorans]